MELPNAKIDATDKSISPKIIINNIAKAMIMISEVFEKIYEKLSGVKKFEVVRDANTQTKSNSKRIAVSQLLLTEPNFANLDITRSSL